MWIRGLLIVALQIAFLQEEPDRETYDDGCVRSECRHDTDGRKHGPWTAYHPNGKKLQTGTFFHGVPDGIWNDFDKTGRLALRRKYERGRILEVRGFDDGGYPPYQIQFPKGGPILTVPGSKGPEPLFRRKKDDIIAKLAELEGKGSTGEAFSSMPSATKPYVAGKLDAGYQADAMRHVTAYRWLCGLSTDLALDPVKSESCQHACVLLSALGEGLSHTPAKAPGMDAAFFKKGYEGANRSNLHQGQASVRAAIDGFMDDSDATNIDRVGHRMWILAPDLKKTGFGMADGIVAMWVAAAPPSAAADFIRYPAPGLFPAAYFKSTAAWNCLVPEGKYQVSGLDVKAWTLDDDYAPREQLEVGDLHVDKSNLIFRPTLPTDLAGLRVLIRISGVKQGKVEKPIVYIVEFFDGAR